MKANRKFKNEDEAVSAVIGVILMVAITVAIAATVYVYVSGMLGGGQESTPNISFTKTSDRLTVSRSDAVLDWHDFEISWDTSGSSAYLNGTGTALSNPGLIGAADTYIHAGDYINVTYTATTIFQIRHVPTNSLMGTWTFAI